MKKFTLGLFVFSALAAAFFVCFTLCAGTSSLPNDLMLFAALALFGCAAGLWFLERRQAPFPWRLAFRILTAVLLLVWIAVFILWAQSQGGSDFMNPSIPPGLVDLYR